MKKLILPVFCSFLLLWLLTGCDGTAEQESDSVPPAQSASDELPTAQATDPVTIAPVTPVPTEVVYSTPVPTEAVPTTPVPAELASGAPDSSELVPGTSNPPETAPVEYPPENYSAFPLIYQNPELPNGCEVTSLAMLLTWAGYPVNKVELSGNYLPKQDFSYSDDARYGPDPNLAFAGEPSSYNGWYCFEGPVLEAANAYLSDQNTTQQAAPLSGTTREELENYMNDGIPLAVWVTLDYTAPQTRESSSWYLPDGSSHVPYINLHCVVLAGWDGDNYLIANPINGWQTISPGTFWSCFDAMGRRAVAILPN